MSAEGPSPEQSAAETAPTAHPSSSQSSKRQRVLACVLCQQRKVKCDRKFPCANCVKFRAQCVPSTLAPRRRRRKVPDQALLTRLSKYEELLQQNNVEFEPLDKAQHGDTTSPTAEGGDDSDEEPPESSVMDISSPSTTAKSERTYEAKNFWNALSRGFLGPDSDSDSLHDDVRATVLKRAVDSFFDRNDDHLLFGSRETAVDLSTLHPEPVQLFKLWQIYLDNINALLKVTHTPSLQGRILEAAGNVKNIDPNLEALLFGIYCISVQSLDEDACQAALGSSREDLLTRYQFGCQQAMMNAGFLRTNDRDCLTGLLLFLVSSLLYRQVIN